ncbi:prepilin-type N-terminal cleavage/methylation domain-containing protein [Archangium violaceum]|uniref:prepilin-type N-terminal cleavage/methylation domain-containing protein n=1 Tax=Archangium violaceum TaxID=83451 RepID=UPI00194DCFE6|nr:prepilin-type N-terminal cleavage/methylation domain-containing protein [Archangium violaceum]QRN95710.1 prepilin-type N-terminal cleavage/methylation domain-containing protein [Archangium violaceum]
MRRQRGFTIIELLVGTAVTFVTVLAVSAAFIGYTQSFYTQAGIRGGQASLRQTHQMVVRNLRMAGYGIEPHLAFDFPAGWRDDATRNRSDRLVFRMRDPAFNAVAASLSSTNITLTSGLPTALRKGQILQVVCPGALAVTYARLSVPAAKGAMMVQLEPGTGAFPTLNDFNHFCFGAGSGGLAINVFKIDVYDYSIQLIDDDGRPGTPSRPYLFRRHGLDEKDPDAFGEPVAEDIEAMRLTFLSADGTILTLNPAANPPNPFYPPYNEPLDPGSPANIRAVRVALVARTSTRDSGIAPGVMNKIPAFADRPELDAPYGFRRILSEMSVQVRNMRSSEMPIPVYSLDSATNACKGVLPEDDFNCAGG